MGLQSRQPCMCLPASLPVLAQSTGLHLCCLQLQVLTMKAILRGHWWVLTLHICDPSAQLLLPQELVNRWSEQIFGAHRDERETADLHERHAQMQEARTARKVAEERAAAADSDKPVSWLASERRVVPQRVCACFSGDCSGARKPLLLACHNRSDEGLSVAFADILRVLHRRSNGNSGISGIDNLHGFRRHSNMVTRASDTMPQSRKQPAWTI